MTWGHLPPTSIAGTTKTSSSPTNKRNGTSPGIDGTYLALLVANWSLLTWEYVLCPVGMLEVKLKHRLLEDPNSVAIGVLHHHRHQHQNSDAFDSDTKKRGKHPKKAHKLPQLAPKGAAHGDHLPDISGGARPISYDAERESVMDALELASPTRSVINKVVHQTKKNKRKQLSELPPVAGAFKKRGAPQSLFPRVYQRNELPIMIESRVGGNTLRWTQPIAEIDFSKYFPLFLEGLTEKTHLYSFLAREGAFQLLQFGKSRPEKVVECLHNVIPAVRQALDTHESKYIREALVILQGLTQTPGIGPLLVLYYRQLLPALNMFKNKRRNLGDNMDFQQHKAKDIGEMILETLELLERTSGPDAYVNIKYMVPTYEGVHT